MYIEQDDFRCKSHNGTVINVFENNYKEYIDIGVREKIKNFIIKNRASVAATIWGHGGVGKTASIQGVCEELISINKKYFDYIVFLSAKDRLYQYYTGTIKKIDTQASSFNKLIITINLVINQKDNYDLDAIYNFDGMLLLVIDDYETFSNEDKDKIEHFIKQLDINHHKVIITTRANLTFGYEIQTNELNKEETKKFLLQIQKIEFPNYAFICENDLNTEIVNQIHKITSGRPLFIIQFAYVVAQHGLSHALSKDLKSNQEAIEFLYGRIYDYLSKIAQDIFAVMGFLTIDSEGDLTNLLEKIKYILKLEHRESEFNTAVEELAKLRIIEIIETRFFRIYSMEIQEIMIEYYQRKSDKFKENVVDRLNQVGKNKKLDNELALLMNADASRVSRNESEVVKLYKHILSRQKCTQQIKLQAILNLGSYLFSDKGNKNEAVKIFNEYSPQFSTNPQFVKMYSIYHWSKGTKTSKKRSIQILLEYFAQSKKGRFKQDINFDLLGTLLTNRSIYWIRENDNTQIQYEKKEITETIYNRRVKNHESKFFEIFKHEGNMLFYLLKTKNYINLSSSSQQNVVAGLYQFVEICIRLKKYQMGIDICYFVLETSKYYKNQFRLKLELINQARNI